MKRVLIKTIIGLSMFIVLLLLGVTKDIAGTVLMIAGAGITAIVFPIKSVN